MPIYRLTKLATILRSDKPVSDFGYAGTTAETVATAWADIRPLNATERVSAEQVVATATHRAIMRFPNKPIDAGMRLAVDGLEFEIGSVTDVNGEGQYLELLCTAANRAVGRITTR